MTLQDWERLRALYGDALIPLIEILQNRRRRPTLYVPSFSQVIHMLHRDAAARFPRRHLKLGPWRMTID